MVGVLRVAHLYDCSNGYGYRLQGSFACITIRVKGGRYGLH